MNLKEAIEELLKRESDGDENVWGILGGGMKFPTYLKGSLFYYDDPISHETKKLMEFDIDILRCEDFQICEMGLYYLQKGEIS